MIIGGIIFLVIIYYAARKAFDSAKNEAVRWKDDGKNYYFQFLLEFIFHFFVYFILFLLAGIVIGIIYIIYND